MLVPGYFTINIQMLLIAAALLLQSAQSAPPVRTIPTFSGSFTTAGKQYSYTMAGRDPQEGGTTTIPVVLVPLALAFEASGNAGPSTIDIQDLLASPLFRPFAFSSGSTQYTDALQRAQFPSNPGWHTLLGTPRVSKLLQLKVPAANGYLLHSRRTGKSLGIVDLDFVKKFLLEQAATVGATPDTLLLALTKDTEFYALGDATVCCSAGTHGAQLDPSSRSAQAFVIASLSDGSIRGVSEQLGEWMNDPLSGYRSNEFPAWRKPGSSTGCGGHGESSAYLLEQPSGRAAKISSGGKSYELENIALLSWFAQKAGSKGPYSFPDSKALTTPAQPCANREGTTAEMTGLPAPRAGTARSKHALIGYWEGYSGAGTTLRLRDVSPQWDIIIATFAAPVKGSTSLLHFEPPAAIGEEEFKSDVAYLKSQGKKVLISLGGGGEVVTLSTPQDLRKFVDSVSGIVAKYNFDGVDLDIETPSLLIDPGDKDFRHPTTPSIVNLITAMHQLHDHFGSQFMISEVPEAAQTQAGMQTYGGQFGCFLPVIYGTRNILSFVDAQDYNTPPLEALDGNYYRPGNADYHVAMSEMLLRGFPVGNNPAHVFPPLPPEQVAIGLPATPTSARNFTSIPDIENALTYLIKGKPYAGVEYKLRQPSGYPGFKGAMFWAIGEDRRNGYKMSNAIGPFLHEMR